jgi:SAM-dependent methyltransferase/O-antigen ligase
MRNKLNKIISNLIFIFITLLSIQTVWVIRDAVLNNFKWQYGVIAIYATEFILFLILALVLFNIGHRHYSHSLSGSGSQKHWLDIFESWPMILVLSLLLVLWSGLLIIWSPAGLVALSAWVKLFEGVLFLFILLSIKYSRKKVALALVIGGVFQSILAISNFLLQEVVAIKWLGISSHLARDLTSFSVSTGSHLWLRAYGGLPHPNILGGFLVVTILSALWLYLSVNHRLHRLLIIIALVIMSTALFFSFSRSAFIALLLAFLVWLIRASFKSGFWKVSRPISYVILTLTVLTALYQPLVSARIFGVGDLEVISIEQRTDYFYQFAELAKQNWLLGTGPGNYTYILYLNSPTLNGWEYQPVHNIYFLILAELGIIGFVIFISLCGVALFRATTEKDPFGLALLIAILIIGLFDHYLWTGYVGMIIFWLVIYFVFDIDKAKDSSVLDWNRAAQEYSSFIGRDGDFVRQSIINPYIGTQIDRASGKKVLDLGCGEGYLARLFQSNGFVFTGVDISQELLNHAREKKTPGVLIQADICDELHLKKEKFDIVIVNMVLMDVNDISLVYQNSFKQLSTGGRLVVTILHPACGRPAGKWHKTLTDKILRRDPFIRLDSYGQEFSRSESIIGLRTVTKVYHRSMADYIQSGISVGFNLDNVSELAPPESDLKRFDQPAFLAKYPMVLALTFIKK